MEKDFNELMHLMNANSSNDLFIFENGEIKPYGDRLEFQYHLSNFHEIVLSELSNMESMLNKIILIEKYQRFMIHLRKTKPF